MSGTPFQSGILIAPLINQTFSLFCQFKLDIFLLWMLPFVWLHSPPYFVFYFCSLSIHPLLVSLSNFHSIIYHITIICVCTLWPLHRCSLTSKSIVFWRSPDFDPLSISQISIMSSFIHSRQVTCGLKAAGLTLARALAGLRLAQDVSVVTGLTVYFSFSGWLDQQSPEGLYHEQSLWGNQAFSQWPQSARYRPAGCACALYLNAMFGNSFEGCVYMGSLLVCVGGVLL